jgi:hypothetical protein
MDMQIVELIYCMLCSLGITAIITRGTIFYEIRKYFEKTIIGKIINCPQCCGFWCGLLISILFVLLGNNILLIPAVTFGTSLISPFTDPIRIWQ